MTSLCPQVVVHVSVGWKEINNDVIIRSLFLLIMTSRNGGISAPLVVIFLCVITPCVLTLIEVCSICACMRVYVKLQESVGIKKILWGGLARHAVSFDHLVCKFQVKSQF